MKSLLLFFFQLQLMIVTIYSPTSHANSSTLNVTKDSFQDMEHNVEIYMDNKRQMTDSYFDLISQEPNFTIKDILYSAHDLAKRRIAYSLGKSYIPADGVKKVGLIDCTHLIEEIFIRAGLPYDYVNTEGMVRKWPAAKKNFEYIAPIEGFSNSFKPQAGDVLAFYNSKRRSGHAVMVIDPLNCIAINSTSWVWTENYQDETVRNPKMTGVYFQEIKQGKCENGIWTSWDNSTNKFQVMLRHKMIIAGESQLENSQPNSQANLGPLAPLPPATYQQPESTNLLIPSLMDSGPVVDQTQPD